MSAPLPRLETFDRFGRTAVLDETSLRDDFLKVPNGETGIAGSYALDTRPVNKDEWTCPPSGCGNVHG
jgi:hypothetical protein